MLWYGTSWIASSLVERSLMISKRQSEAVNLKDRQYNLKKNSWTNNVLQSTTQKTRD